MSGSRTSDLTPEALTALAGALLDAFALGYDRDDADDLALELIRGGYTITAIDELDTLERRAIAAEAALERLTNYAEAAGDCYYGGAKHGCDHAPILHDEAERARAALSGHPRRYDLTVHGARATLHA